MSERGRDRVRERGRESERWRNERERGGCGREGEERPGERVIEREKE